MMKSDQLLKDFGNYIGVRNMLFDSKRTCSLMVDKDSLIIINDLDDKAIMLSCIVGTLLPQTLVDSKTAMELLSVNMLFAAENGPYVGYEPQGKALVLSVANPQEEMTPQAIESQIAYLLKNKQQVRQTLEERDIALA